MIRTTDHSMDGPADCTSDRFRLGTSGDEKPCIFFGAGIAQGAEEKGAALGGTFVRLGTGSKEEVYGFGASEGGTLDERSVLARVLEAIEGTVWGFEPEPCELIIADSF